MPLWGPQGALSSPLSSPCHSGSGLSTCWSVSITVPCVVGIEDLFVSHRVCLSVYMNRCVIKWGDGHSLKGETLLRQRARKHILSRAVAALALTLSPPLASPHCRAAVPGPLLPLRRSPWSCPVSCTAPALQGGEMNAAISTVSTPTGKLRVLKE